MSVRILWLSVFLLAGCAREQAARGVAATGGAWPSRQCLEQALGRGSRPRVLESGDHPGSAWIVAYADPSLERPRRGKNPAVRPVRLVQVVQGSRRCQALGDARATALAQRAAQDVAVWCRLEGDVVFDPALPTRVEHSTEEGCFDVHLEVGEGRELVCREEWKAACG